MSGQPGGSAVRRVVDLAAEGVGAAYGLTARGILGVGPLGRGPSGTAIREGRACVIQDLYSDSRALPWREIVIRHRFRSAGGLPLGKRGQVVGAVTV